MNQGDIYLYDEQENRLKDEQNKDIKANLLFPNLETKSKQQWMNMFSDISYCDNLDEMEYNELYVLKDDQKLYNTYEGFSRIEMDYIEKLYLLIFSIFMISLIVFKKNDL
ncbi:hypothetical protein 162322400 [Organic Lake phycodnavirus 1]|jgi:hypothetical protein|nr:hypothetical protein 162322400 [Organic Lake phycodnavirus 1]